MPFESKVLTDFTVEFRSDILSAKVLKVLLFSAGVIKVFIEHQKEPLAVVVEKNPLPIQYIGFASKDNSLATFFYDCEGEHTYGEEDFKDMCQYAQAYEVGDTDFYKITDIPGSRSEEFILNFPFFVKTGRDARILLTKEAKVGYNDADYNFCNVTAKSN